MHMSCWPPMTETRDDRVRLERKGDLDRIRNESLGKDKGESSAVHEPIRDTHRSLEAADPER